VRAGERRYALEPLTAFAGVEARGEDALIQWVNLSLPDRCG